MWIDYHLHTSYSDDSDYKMKHAVERAISLGLQEICFCDHVDYGVKMEYEEYEKLSKEGQKGKRSNVDYPRYFKEIERLRKQFEDNILIKAGMEFGVQQHTIPAFQRLFSKYPFDFIILSCHQVEDKEFWTQAFQKGKSQAEYHQRYYQEILNVITSYKKYSVLGHLDLLKRYDLKGKYPFENTREIVTSILKMVIKDGKGIEVNTSSFHYGLNDFMPAKSILQLYYELGGTIITVGSDAHREEHVGAHCKDVLDELKTIGFRYICTFENMKPMFHEL